MIKFCEMKDTVLENFCGGQGALIAKMFNDGKNKILKGTLPSGSSIGLHCHETSSEIIFILEGKGKVIYDGELERLCAGDCHYCEKGRSHSLINDSAEDIVFYAVVPQQ